ncbi:MAG: CCA tRNA nucleotidyltransferase [Dehalococcoidales bacterium]|nr:CCA tRNA nucleotidyltransferase [Dehalococcoidales bacterium]
MTGQIEKRLPPEVVSFLRKVGEAAETRGQGLYLVGGVVRDLLLGRSNLDLDLVVEGDAIALARELANEGKIITHTRFGTAKIGWNGWSVDLATARSETYARPGALPIVKPGSIESDLFRRDFTINAMAVKLDPGIFGGLIDLYRGRDDLEHRLIRVLHNKSFTDDATRIWRGIRYEQRLDFKIEPDTLKLLERDVPMLDTVSGDRIRHELELVFKEELPERALRSAGELGVLSRLHPSLRADSWLTERFKQARENKPKQLGELYLALLAYRVTANECEQVISYLRLPKAAAQTLRDTINLKMKLKALESNPSPGSIYATLHSYSSMAIEANLLAADSAPVRENLRLYLDKLRYVKPALTGSDLQKMGLAPGPRMKEVLERLREARLEGKATSRGEEEALVREWLRAG